MYCFPRVCPRLLLWPIGRSADEDIEKWMGEDLPRMVAHIETGWIHRFEDFEMFRDEFRSRVFDSLTCREYVSESTQNPLNIQPVCHLGIYWEAVMSNSESSMRFKKWLTFSLILCTSQSYVLAIRSSGTRRSNREPVIRLPSA